MKKVNFKKALLIFMGIFLTFIVLAKAIDYIDSRKYEQDIAQQVMRVYQKYFPNSDFNISVKESEFFYEININTKNEITKKDYATVYLFLKEMHPLEPEFGIDVKTYSYKINGSTFKYYDNILNKNSYTVWIEEQSKVKPPNNAEYGYIDGYYTPLNSPFGYIVKDYYTGETSFYSVSPKTYNKDDLTLKIGTFVKIYGKYDMCESTHYCPGYYIEPFPEWLMGND